MLELWNNVKTYKASLFGFRFLGLIFAFSPRIMIFFNLMRYKPNIPIFHYSIIPIVSKAN